MCDCFHLAFPNWHAPAAGAGRRLRGPEQEAEDDSVCEDPEVLERERPRPQGSSPVEEFPVEKQAEEDMSDTVHKSGSNKKSRKAGFGSLFEKRTSDKMNETEDVQSGESEVIVKTVKEASVEGLVVTGGRKEGIFIKEVKLDSPASRELRVKEGDQILSATVYFDNVSYEDALQILEHAQPFKMEFCLRRKVEPSIPENAELIHPEEKDHGPPVMRSQRKMKKQQERISWPKFPSFGKGPRVQFNRSHSTSEAEEHRKLELSPPTSDNESPIKSPLKCPDGKDKNKKHKVEVKIKMRGHRSKSVEEHQTNENVNVQAEGILEEKVPEGHEKEIQDILQVLDGAEYEISTKTENDDPFQMERHEAHLISLGNTLKTTDISVALAEGGKRESSEMKVKVHEEGTPHIGVEKQAESFQGLYTISAPPAHDNDVLPQAVVEKFDNDLSTQGTGKDSSEKKVEFGHAELGMPILDICVGASKKSPRIGDEKQRRSGFQNESYGIRTRGPMADIATAKTHFVRTENGLQFISPDFSERMQVGKTEDKLTDKEEIKTSTLPTERLILADLDRTSSSKFKLPKIENSGFVPDEEIKITEMEKITHLPKRDDIEIPGMENKEIKPSLQTPEIKLIKTEKMINMTKEREIQYHQIDEEFNVEDVKVAVSKFPCFKLPEGDITGVLVQREITIMEQKSEKSTPRGSPRKISTTSTDSCTSIPKSKVGEEKSPSADIVNKDTAFKVPKVELPSIDEQTSTALMKIDYTQLQITDYERFGDINFKLPKREDIEIPGMEAIKESKLQDTEIKTVSGADLDKAERPRTKKHSDKKSHDKKSKKPSQPENQSPSISTELQKRDPSKINTEETRIHEKHTFKIPKIGEVENIDSPVQEIKRLEDTVDKKDMPQKTETSKTKFKIPSITLPEFGTKVPRGAVDISAEDVQVKEVEIILPEDKFKLSDEPLISDLEGTDVNKDGQAVNVYGRVHDTETGQGTKFKLPKFEISFPEVKAPRIICTSKKDDDSSLSERESAEVPVVHPSKVELPEGKLDVSTDQTEINSEVTKVKIKRPGFSFPRFGIATSEHTIQEANVNLTNVDMSLPEGSIETQSPNAKIAISVKEGKQKDATKFKIPSIKFPNFGAKVTKAVAETSYVEPDVKGAQISLPDTEVKLPKETITIKDSDGEKEKKSEFIYMDIQAETQRSKFKLPKFPEVKEPKIDISSDIDISMEKVKINSPDIEEQAGIHEVKVDLPFGMKIPKTAREMEVSLSEVDVDVKGPEIVLPDAKIKLSAEPLSVDLKGPDADKEINSLSMDVKVQDIQIKEKGSKFKSPTYGISIPEIKGPKINMSSDKKEIDISVPKAQVDVHPPSVEVQGAKANLPEVCSKDFKTKRETPGFSFPKVDFSKSDVKAPEADVSVQNVDLSLSERNIEVEKPTTDVEISIEDAELKGRSKFGSPTKFKLPSLNFPKFGVKVPKTSVEIPDVDVEVKGPEISLPDAEIKLSAEPLSVDGKGPDANKQTKSVSMEMKDQDIQIKEQGTKFKLPHFGISLPEIKGPKIDVSSGKAEIDISGPKGKVEVHPPDVELQGVTAEVKADLPELDSKDFEIKMKTPGFSFPKIGFDQSEVEAPEVDVTLPEGNLEIEKPTTDVTVSIEDAELKGRSKFGSPTKFKLPSLNFPKFGVKVPKTSVEIPDVDVEVKGPEISLPDAEIKLSAEPLSVDGKGPDANKQTKSVSMEMKDQDIQIKEQGTKFKLPHFGISLPEIKGPKIDVSSGKAEIDISGPKGKVEVHPPDVELQGVTAEVKADLPELDSKDFEIKMKTPGFSFPKIGFDQSEVEAPEVDVTLPEGNLEIEKPTTDVTVSIEDAELKGRSKFGSPTKFKLPSLNFPKFGVKGPKASLEIPDVEADVKGPEISLPDAEIKLSAEPLSVDVKGPDANKQTKSVSMEMKDQDIQIKEQGTKFKLPNFGISLPEIKGPKLDVSSGKAEIDISGPKGKVEVHPPDVELQGVTAEVKADLPEVDSKDFEIKMKTPGFSFPKIRFDKSEVKAPEVDVSLPEGNLEIEKPTTDVTVSIEDAELKGRSKFGSPTKFKLPSLNFPKFGVKVPKASVEIPDVDVEVKGPEISLPDAEIKLSAEPLSVDVKGPDANKQTKSVSMEMKDQDIQIKEQGTKFKLPNFGISLPEIKGPKLDVSSGKAEIDISGPKGKVEVHPPDVELQGVTAEVKADLPEVDSKDFEIKMKTPGFSFPKIRFDKSEVKAPEVDVSLPEGNLEIEKPTTDVTVSIEDAALKGRSKFGSPTKFKLPSLNFPKFGVKGPKASVEIPDVDVEVKGPEINLPDAEIKLPAEPLSVDVKGPDANKQTKSVRMEMKDQDIQIKEQGTKFKLPNFGISLPEIKGPKIDVSSGKAEIDISGPKGKVEVHPPDVELQGVTAEVKADLPELDSKDFEIKMKTPGFSFPKIGFDKSEVKAPEVDVSLPEGNLEIEKPTTDVTVSIEDAELKGRSKFGSPTKFKLPSLNFPKFGGKGPKASVEIPDVEADVKGPEISLPDAEIKLSAEPLSVDVKGPDANKQTKSVSMEMKDQDIQIKEQGAKFKLPNFGISLPEIKGPKIDVSSGKAEIDISGPKGKVEVHPPDVELQGVTAEVRADLPEVDSKDFEIKMKTPGFSFPKIGFDKSEVKAPEVDVSLPEGNLEIEQPTTDVTVSTEDAELKGRSKFGSPTKFKLPSLNFPKFGIKGSKASVEIPNVEADVKGPEISLPDAEIKLSAEPLSVDVKGPKIDVSSRKAKIDISVPKGKVEVHPPDVEVQGVTAEVKADLPKVDSKDFEVKMKTPGFSFPKIGFDKSEVKAPAVDVSLPEGNLEIEKPTTDVTVSIDDSELKGRSKFGSPTKFKFPSIDFPKFGAKGPKASVEIPDVDVEVKRPEIILPDAEIKLSVEPPSVDVKAPDADKETKSVSMEIKNQDIQIKEQGTKFKLPNFGISLPEIKGPKLDVSSGKAEIDISGPKGKVEVHPPDVELQGVTAEVKADLPELDSKDFEIKVKTPGFSFPKIGFDKSEVKAPEVDVSLPEGNLEIEKPTTDVTVSIEDAELKGRSKFGSPTKFKLPSLNFPKFGVKGPKASVEIPDVDVEVKGPEINLPDAEIKLPAEPRSVDVKGPDANKQTKSVSMEMKDQDIQIKEQGTKFKLPNFGISLPEIKGPKIDVSSGKAEIDISGPKGKVEVHPPDVELQGVTAEVRADLPEVDSKDFEIKMKTPGFSFPKIGFDKSEVKVPEVDVSLLEGNLEIEQPTTDVTVSTEDAELKGRSKFGSPTKFKLPSLNFPKFGIKGSKASVEIPNVEADVKGPEISLPDAEIKLSAEPLSVDVKGPKIDVSSRKAKIDISVPKGKVEVHPPDVEVQGVTAEVKADLPKVDSKDFEVKMKTPGFSFPKIGFDKSEVKAPAVDVSLPEGNLEIEKPTTDVTVSIDDSELKGRSKFGSPTKFKFPSIDFPKFGAKGPKASVEIPDVDVEVKRPEIILPDAEIKLSVEPPSVDVKAPDADKETKSVSMEIKNQDIQIKEQGTKFKLPNFGISLPEIKGPKIDASSGKTEIDISVPKGKVEVHPPDVEVQSVTAEVKADLPELDTKDFEVKMKTPGFSFPKIGFDKSEVKAREVDVSLPEGNLEIEKPTTDVTVSIENAELKGRSKFGSPTKFKLPSLNFPKFGVKGPKASVEIPNVESDVKGPEISLPDAEIKLSAEPLSVDVKGPKIDVSSGKAGIDISLPKGKVEVHPPDVEVQGVTAKVKADLPEMDSKNFEVKMKTPGFSFPKIGFDKSEVKTPEVDVSLPEGNLEIEKPTTDVTVSIEDAELKGRSKFGSPTKLKFPSINFPKFGAKGPKASVEIPDVDVEVKRPEISLPHAEIKQSVEPLSVDVKGPDADKETKSVSMEIKNQDIQIKEQGTKFKLPKFGISLPEIKGPKIDVGSDKAEIDISIPKGKVEVHPPDVEVQGLTAEVKADLPEVDSKDFEVKMKTPGLSFSKFSKSDTKVPASDLSLQIADISTLEKSKIEGPTTEITAEQNLLTKSSSPTKLKFPLINIPKFVKGLEVSLPDAHFSAESVSEDIKEHAVTKIDDFGMRHPKVRDPEINIVGKSTSKAESGISLTKEVKTQSLNVKVKNLEINNDDHIPQMDSLMGTYNAENDKARLDILESKQKYTQRVKTSSKLILPALADVLSGFEVEFNVPTFDENEGAKKIYPDIPLTKEECNITVKGQFSAESVSKHEDGGAQEKSKTEQNNLVGQKQTQPEISDWFRFPAFSSPTKTAKDNERITSQLLRKAEPSPENDINENECKQSFSREFDEDNISPTLSLSSSDAFADISSALTTEQISLSLSSPTKVKVKYSESIANAEGSDIHIVTSTARSELISIEPHQPEKVNIPFSSETSSSSVDTLKQIPGHIVVANVQSVSKTEHATIITKVDKQELNTLPAENVTDSMLSTEETTIQTEHRTIYQKHSIKEVH